LAKHVNLGPDGYSRRIAVDGQQYGPSRPWDTINNNYVDVEFFDTMGTPIVRGRAIDARDGGRAPKVAVVNETMATRFWPNRDPIGQLFTLVGDPNEAVEVIGVARNAKYFNALEPAALSYFYLPYRQHLQESMTLHVRTSTTDALALVPALRREVQALAPDLPMVDLRSMRDVFENKGLLAARLMAQMVGVMGLIGATLAIVGLYAVMAFVVTHRTREIGIRMALGATRASVARMTLGWGLKAAVAGLVLGLALALSLANVLRD
ncbi:MAG: FtsX-like permease family protein, partial [Luteitalea sp.]|nr:FtsX-like permease family protein [Luteitalea sp.]